LRIAARAYFFFFAGPLEGALPAAFFAAGFVGFFVVAAMGSASQGPDGCAREKREASTVPVIDRAARPETRLFRSVER
jgi:hypothetical protein